MDAARRSPTFFVSAEKQRRNLDEFQCCEQKLSTECHKERPLCFSAQACRKTHPKKAWEGRSDADATMVSPMVLGVADGVSQVEDFGIDGRQLPRELLRNCRDIGMRQLVPGSQLAGGDAYGGPIPLLRRAFEATESHGSTTVVLALLDNNTRIHGKLHPMIAVVTVGDCELLILRRTGGKTRPYDLIFHTEMQRIDGDMQTPLQLARIDARIDPDFHHGITTDVIEKGSAVHCASAFEWDLIVMGSDGVFDNLFLDEITDLCNGILPSGESPPAHESVLRHLARAIVQASHAKTERGCYGNLPECPIGCGGKIDDTSVVVAELVPWTEAHTKAWAPPPPRTRWQLLCACGDCCAVSDDSDMEFDASDDGGPKE